MTVMLDLPDDIAGAVPAHGDLSRQALERLALEEFRAGRLSQVRLRRLLGFSTRYELDGFLKAHREFVTYSIEDFDREWEELRKAGF